MIVIVANFVVKPENLKEVIRLSRKMQECSRLEPGCRAYVAHQSLEDPHRFCFYEAYDDESAIAAHRATVHYAEYVTNGLMKIIVDPDREKFRPLDFCETTETTENKA